MFIHLRFSDQSNPYFRLNMDRAEFINEKRKWSRNYKLTLEKECPEGKFFYAERKEK